MQLGSWRRLLIDHDSVHDGLRAVRIGPLQQEPVIVADKPGVEGLHAPKVGHLDGWFGQFRSPRFMVRQTALGAPW